MADQLVQMRFGGVDVLVQATREPGTERTSRSDELAAKTWDALDHAHEVIVNAAASTGEMLTKLAGQAARPAKLEVEFGLGFSVKGNVIVASGSADATLKVKLVYEPAAAE